MGKGGCLQQDCGVFKNPVRKSGMHGDLINSFLQLRAVDRP